MTHLSGSAAGASLPVAALGGAGAVALDQLPPGVVADGAALAPFPALARPHVGAMDLKDGYHDRGDGQEEDECAQHRAQKLWGRRALRHNMKQVVAAPKRLSARP